MQVQLNGQPKDVAGGTTVQSLLAELGVNPKTVVVQRNDDILDRDSFAATPLMEGDAVEIIQFVGGG